MNRMTTTSPDDLLALDALLTDDERDTAKTRHIRVTG